MLVAGVGKVRHGWIVVDKLWGRHRRNLWPFAPVKCKQLIVLPAQRFLHKIQK